MGVKIMGGK